MSTSLSENAARKSYSPSSKKWEFQTDGSTFGYISVTEKSLGKQLTKLKATGFIHNCFIEYDTDSKIEAMNGNFYSVFKVSQCD